MQPWAILPESLLGGTQVSTFQFYVKEAVAVHLDVDSATFLAEKEQLVTQGFERVGDIIQADNSGQAFEKFKSIHLNELGEFAGSHLVASVISSISSY